MKCPLASAAQIASSPATSVAATISANLCALPSPLQPRSVRHSGCVGSLVPPPNRGDGQVGQPGRHVQVAVAGLLEIEKADAGVDDLRDILAAGRCRSPRGRWRNARSHPVLVGGD
jgi:hypothetical protein